MTVEMISLSISLKGMWRNWDSNLQPLDLQSDVLPTVLWSLAIWAVPCENCAAICRQRRPRSAYASVQSDQILICPLTESLDTTKCMNGKA